MNFCGPLKTKCYLLRQINEIMVLNCPVCLEWPCVASPRMVLLLFTTIDMCSLVWSCMTSLWTHMVFYGRISSFLAVIDLSCLQRDYKT